MPTSTRERLRIDWRTPVLPARTTGWVRSDRPDSPLSCRILDVLELGRDERVLVVGARDPQLIVSAARLVGPAGWVRCVDPSSVWLDRCRRHTGDHLNVQLVHGDVDVPGARWDAIVAVHRDGVVPDMIALAELSARLAVGGRLVVAAFAAPAGQIAVVGRHEPDRRPGAERARSIRPSCPPADGA